jgi:hypothetical protein
MRVFWALIALLVLAAAALLALPRFGAGSRSGSGGPAAEPPAVATPPAPAPGPSTRRPTDDLPTAPSPRASPPAPAPEPATPPAAAAARSEPAAAASAQPEPGLPPGDLPEPLSEMVESTLGQPPPDADGSTPQTAPTAVPASPEPGSPGPPSESPVEPSPPAAATTPGAAPAPASAPAPARIINRDDGSMLVDDRFVIKGKGTRAEPYEITWDFLVSAEETYKPRLGQKRLPDRLSIVKDKYVRINGYVAFPIMAQEPDEMLAMLNQWDGCCIGVPPTPYDAIEVKLRKAAEKDDRFAVYGTVEGRLGVDPYLVKDWLIGLYTMDDAVLKAER